MVRATLTGGHSQRATSASTPEVRQVKTSQLQGNVEKVQDKDGFLQLRFGREPGDYIIFHVPATCRIHRDGVTLPLKDVQFCDSAIVRYHRHPRFDLQLAQEIELN